MAGIDFKMYALREHIECAVQHAVFTDVYKNRVNSFTIEHEILNWVLDP